MQEVSELDQKKWLWLAWGALLPLLVLVFFPAFSGPFLLDDASGIVNNSEFRELSVHNLIQLFRGHPDVRAYDHHPVAGFTALLDSQWSGRDPFGFHITNLLIHWCVAGAMLFLYWSWRKESSREALLTGIGIMVLWAVHPFATMPVAYITGRQESLMVLFYVLALAFYLRNQRGLAWLCALASFLSKEVGVTIPFAFLAIDWARSGRNPLRILWNEKWFYGPLGASWALICWYLLRGNRKDHILSTDMPLAGPIPYFKAELGVIVNYFVQAVWPAKLQFYPYLQATRTVADWAIPLGLILLYVAGALMLLRWSRWATIAALMPFLVLAPTSSFIPLPFEPAMEYRMYLPFFFLASLAITALTRHTRPLALQIVLLALPTLAFAARSHWRTRDYKSSIALHESQLQVDPRSLTALEALAGDYANAEMPDRSERAAKLLFDYSLEQGARDFSARALRLLGGLSHSRLQWAEAKDYYERSLQLSNSDGTKCQLANVLVGMQQYAKAEEILKEILTRVPDFVDATLYLYESRLLQKDFDGAARYLDQVERQHPDHPLLERQKNRLDALRREAARGQ